MVLLVVTEGTGVGPKGVAWTHRPEAPSGGRRPEPSGRPADVGRLWYRPPMAQTRRATSLGSNDEISPLDKEILEHLQADGRRPFTQIAAELGVSEAAVRARTNRLIERGVLQIVGVTDPLKLGYDQMAMVGVRCEGDQVLVAAEAIAALPEVIYVVVTAGAYDLLVEAVCEDNEALLRFLTEKLRKVPGVQATETFVYLRIVKQAYEWGGF
jgi:Lrp/AsnC family transcriptional regulator for asnA, asnC and gidA